MRTPFFEQHWTDAAGHPAGGVSSGTGFCISWQNGPLGREPERKEPNGAFVETLLAASAGRLEFYQTSGFACRENQEALEKIYDAMDILARRTRDRETRGVEGTHRL